jgi:hypothetical protein
MDAEVERVLEGIEERLELGPEELAYVERRRRLPRPQELGRRGDAALAGRRYREAATCYRAAASLVPSERPLVWKARAMSAAPNVVGPLVRRRQLRIEDKLGVAEGHRR